MTVEELVNQLESMDSIQDFEVKVVAEMGVPDDFKTGLSILKVVDVQWDHLLQVAKIITALH